MPTVNQQAIVRLAADRLNVRHGTAEWAYEAIIATLFDLLEQQHSVDLQGFGTFEVYESRVNPKRAASVGQVTPLITREVVFHPHQSLFTALNRENSDEG